MRESGAPDAVPRAIRAAFALADRPVVLAVSGGADSMALMHAAASVAPSLVALVATFDHGSGPAAQAAARLVTDVAATRGLPVLAGGGASADPRETSARPTEAAWRAARWAFLRRAAAACGPGTPIATAHTRDDQLETVVMRALRGAGARGLAGLDTDTDVLRPLLMVARRDVRAYVTRHAVPVVEDPSNASDAHLRNRVRRDLLPAIGAVRPDFGDEMLSVARRAAAWRRDVERWAERHCPVTPTADGAAVAAAALAGYDPATLAIIWPAVAARVGVTLDRRGTTRLAAFTRAGKVGGTIQLSGGVEVVRSRFLFVIRAPC